MRTITAILATATTVATALTAAPPKSDTRTAVELVPPSTGFSFADTRGIALNDRGEIVVRAADAAGVIQRSLLWSDGALIDLGSWAAYGINERRQIVGSLAGVNGIHAALWDAGRLTDLHPPTPPGSSSIAAAISDGGLIAGPGTFREGTHYCPCDQFVLWDRGTVQALGVYSKENDGDDTARPFAINARGEIAGTSIDYDPVSRMRAVVFRGGDWTDLGGLTPIAASQALGINNRGQVVGRSEDPPGTPHAVLWDRGTIVDLGSPGQATAINDAGNVVGWLQVANRSGGTQARAFLWDGRTLGELPPLPGSQHSYALAINNRGDVAGYSAADGFDPHPRATLWSKKDRSTSK